MGRYRIPHLLLLGVVALAAEMTVLSTTRLWGCRLELLLLLACFAALFARDAQQAAWAAWTLGILKDIGGAGPTGLYALLFLAIGVGIHRLRHLLFREHPVTQAAVAFAGAAWVVFGDGVYTSLSVSPLPFSRLLAASLGSGIVAALGMPFLVALLRSRRWLLR